MPLLVGGKVRACAVASVTREIDEAGAEASRPAPDYA